MGPVVIQVILANTSKAIHVWTARTQLHSGFASSYPYLLCISLYPLNTIFYILWKPNKSPHRPAVNYPLTMNPKILSMDRRIVPQWAAWFFFSITKAHGSWCSSLPCPLAVLSQADLPPRALALADASAWEILPLNIKIAFLLPSLDDCWSSISSLSPPVCLSNLAYHPLKSPSPASCFFSPYLSLVDNCHFIYVHGTGVFAFVFSVSLLWPRY